jgi:hypothetical protein
MDEPVAAGKRMVDGRIFPYVSRQQAGAGTSIEYLYYQPTMEY